MHARACKPAHADNGCMHAYARMHAYECARMHAGSHSCAHTRARIHTHTHTHTQTHPSPAAARFHGVHKLGRFFVNQLLAHTSHLSLRGRICLLRDPKRCRLATRANLRKIPARQVRMQATSTPAKYIIPLRFGAPTRLPVSISCFHVHGSLVTEMRCDDLGSWGKDQRLQQPSSSRCSYRTVPGTSPDARPWMASWSRASLRIDTCSDSSAVATGRTPEDSVARHRMIRRRRVCYAKTLPAGRFLSDFNERARSLASDWSP